MSNLLITGGAGFIGANFVHYWHRRHSSDRLVVLDALTYAGNLENLSALEGDTAYRFVQGDICDKAMVEQLMRDEDIDLLVHFAAESHVDRSILGPDEFIRTNIMGTYALLTAAKAVWLDSGSGREHRFHHVSTDEVYGSLSAEDPAFSETTSYAPSSPYSASKAASDHLVRAYHHTYGLQVTTSNCSNNYGPYQFPEKLIPLFMINALHGKALPVYGDGKHVRDWLFVEDHCRGIELVIGQGALGGTYNVGGNCEMENIQIVNEICSGLDQAFERDPLLRDRFPDAPQASGGSAVDLITYVEDRLGHDRRYAIDAGKITAELGYAAAYDFRTGFDATLSWYLQEEAWWRGLLNGS